MRKPNITIFYETFNIEDRILDIQKTDAKILTKFLASKKICQRKIPNIFVLKRK